MEPMMAAPAEQRDLEHLLRRTGFTATPEAVARLTGLSWEDAVDSVLDVSAAPDPAAGIPTVGRAPAPVPDFPGDYRRMVHHWLDRCATTPTPIVEKMTHYWHGHLTSAAGVAPLGPILDQHLLYQRRGLGRFDDLVTATAIDPALLLYLDGKSSHRWDPNENFPRELMELFCLGIGNYTEGDVRAASRAFTGYRLRTDDYSYFYDPDWHDGGNKTFMGVTRNWDGPTIIDHVLNGPTRPIAARHVARRLWSFLAYPDPDEAVVTTIANAFASADLQIVPLLRAILHHPEFRSTRSRQGLLRSPIELAVAAITHTGIPASAMRPEWFLADMGQQTFMPPNVDGWPQNDAWIATSTMWARRGFADRVGHVAAEAGALHGSEQSTPADAATAALHSFGITAPSVATRDALTSFVAATRVQRPWAERRGLIAMTVLAPEFALA